MDTIKRLIKNQCFIISLAFLIAFFVTSSSMFFIVSQIFMASAFVIQRIDKCERKMYIAAAWTVKTVVKDTGGKS